MRIDNDFKFYDILSYTEYHEGRGDQIRISVAPGQDGIIRRMVVDAKVSGTRPNWIIFALRNVSNKSFKAYIEAPFFSILNPMQIFRDVSSRRINNITASFGPKLNRIQNNFSDIFETDLSPGETNTYVIELSGTEIPALYFAKATELRGILSDRFAADCYFGIFLSLLVITTCILIFLESGSNSYFLVPIIILIIARWFAAGLLIPAAVLSVESYSFIVVCIEIVQLIAISLAIMYFNEIKLKKEFFAPFASVGSILLIALFNSNQQFTVLVSAYLFNITIITLCFGTGVAGLVFGKKNYLPRTSFWGALFIVKFLPFYIAYLSSYLKLNINSIGSIIYAMFFISIINITILKYKSINLQIQLRNYIRAILPLSLFLMGLIALLLNLPSYAMLRNAELFYPTENINTSYENIEFVPTPGDVTIKVSPLPQ